MVGYNSYYIRTLLCVCVRVYSFRYFAVYVNYKLSYERVRQSGY